MILITIQNLVDWIVANRKGDAFKNYPHNKIANEIQNAMSHNVFLMTWDEEGALTGVVCGERCDDGHYIVIHDILLSKHGLLKKFMQHYLSLYKGWKLVAKRNGKLTTYYNPEKLERKMK